MEHHAWLKGSIFKNKLSEHLHEYYQACAPNDLPLQSAHFMEVLNSPIYIGNLETFALFILVVQLGVQLVQLHRACSHKGPVLGLMLHCHHFEITDNLTFQLVVCKWSMNRGNRSGVNICTSYWPGCLAQMCTP